MTKYVSPTTAMSHQIEALRRRSLRPPGYADAFSDVAEMGCGKTKVILDEWQEMVSRHYVSDLLVVGPAGCLRNWHADKSDDQPSEMRRHLDPRLYRQTEIAAWGPGERARRDVKLLVLTRDRPRALFVNVEAISTSEKVVELCAQFLRAEPGRPGAMFVVDESTVIRARKSERTKAIVRVLGPLAKVRRIMTGLITPKSPMDLFWQFYFLDPRILGHGDSFVTFRERYALTRRSCYEPNEVIRAKLRQAMGLEKKLYAAPYYRNTLRMVYDTIGSARRVSEDMTLAVARTELEVAADGMKRDQAVACIIRLGSWIKSHVEIEEYRNLDELREKIAPFSYRVLKEDCMDLPPKIYASRDVELTPEQKRMYAEMLKHCTTELEGQHVVASTVIAQMIRLHQIALGHSRDENKVVFDVPSRRADALIEVLEDHDGKAIIWSSYRREIEKIVAALEKRFGPGCAAQFHGGNKSARDDEEKRFLSDPRCLYMVSTQAAGGRGNTWTVASLVVYCSSTHDLEHRMQSEDRAHRKGQTRAVTYVDLIARGTVEEKIIRALREKIDLATAITGENYRSWLI